MKPTIKHAYATSRFSGHSPAAAAWFSLRWYFAERLRIRKLRAFLNKYG
jgi:hypothetical protein